MRSFIIGCAVVAVALGILAYVAIYPYMGRVRLPALPVATVADRSLPPVMLESDRQNATKSTPTVTTKESTERVMKAPQPVARPVHKPSPSRCGPELVAEDLAGQCRSKPRATMGALKALGTSAARGAKTTGSAGAGKQ